MGRFVNPNNSAFQDVLNSKIYVDKTGLLEYTNSVMDTTDKFICNSRPRRFFRRYKETGTRTGRNLSPENRLEGGTK